AAGAAERFDSAAAVGTLHPPVGRAELELRQIRLPFHDVDSGKELRRVDTIQRPALLLCLNHLYARHDCPPLKLRPAANGTGHAMSSPRLDTQYEPTLDIENAHRNLTSPHRSAGWRARANWLELWLGRSTLTASAIQDSP